MIAVLVAIHVLVCLFLILIILMQPGKGESLSEVFGGSVTQNIFGAKAGTFLTKATTALAIIFGLSSVLLGLTLSHRGKTLMDTEIVKESKQSQPAPIESPADAGTKEGTPSADKPAVPAESSPQEPAPSAGEEKPSP